MSEISNLWTKLAASKEYREEFVVSQVKQGIPFQVRAMRKGIGISQQELAERSSVTQGVISRAEDLDYGNLSLNTLIRIAAGFDVAFIGNFVPFSDLVDWFENLSEDTVQISSFEQELRKLQRENLRVARKNRNRRRSSVRRQKLIRKESLATSQSNGAVQQLSLPLQLAGVEARWPARVIEMPRQQRPSNNTQSSGALSLGGQYARQS